MTVSEGQLQSLRYEENTSTGPYDAIAHMLINPKYSTVDIKPKATSRLVKQTIEHFAWNHKDRLTPRPTSSYVCSIYGITIFTLLLQTHTHAHRSIIALDTSHQGKDVISSDRVPTAITTIRSIASIIATTTIPTESRSPCCVDNVH